MCFATFDIICCHTFNQIYFWLLSCSSVSNKCTANCHMKHQVCRLQPWSHLPVQCFHINSRVLTLQLELLMFCLRHSKPQIAHAGKYNCKESLCSAVSCRNLSVLPKRERDTFWDQILALLENPGEKTSQFLCVIYVYNFHVSLCSPRLHLFSLYHRCTHHFSVQHELKWLRGTFLVQDVQFLLDWQPSSICLSVTVVFSVVILIPVEQRVFGWERNEGQVCDSCVQSTDALCRLWASLSLTAEKNI